MRLKLCRITLAAFVCIVCSAKAAVPLPEDPENDVITQLISLRADQCGKPAKEIAGGAKDGGPFQRGGYSEGGGCDGAPRGC